MFQYLATLRNVQQMSIFTWKRETWKTLSPAESHFQTQLHKRDFFHSSLSHSSMALASLSPCSQNVRARATETDSPAVRVSSLVFFCFHFVPILCVWVQFCLCLCWWWCRPFKIYISHKRNHFSRSALVARLVRKKKNRLQICEIK